MELLLVFEILACYTLVTIYLEKTVLGDGCVGLIIEAMSMGVHINSLNLSDSSNRIDDEVINGFMSSKNSQFWLELELMLADWQLGGMVYLRVSFVEGEYNHLKEIISAIVKYGC